MEESLKIDRMSFAKKRQRDMESFSPDRDYPQLARKQAERISSLEEENRRMREALHQCLGNLKALGAENGWGAEAVRAALSQEEKQ